MLQVSSYRLQCGIFSHYEYNIEVEYYTYFEENQT